MNQMMGRGVRTLAETRDGRVTVTIEIGVAEMSGRSYDPDKAVETMTENYRRALDKIDQVKSRASAETNLLNQQIEELTRKLAESRELVAFKNNVIESLNDDLDRERETSAGLRKRAERAQDAVNGRDLALGELATVRGQVETLKVKLAVAQDDWRQMDDRRQAAWSRVSELEDGLVIRDRLLQEATHRLGEVQEIVNRDSVTEAMRYQAVPAYVDALKEVVKDIRTALSSSPAPTSQA